MSTPEPRPWWKKKRYLIPIGIAILLSIDENSSKTQAPQQLVQKVEAGAYTTGTSAIQSFGTSQKVAPALPTQVQSKSSTANSASVQENSRAQTVSPVAPAQKVTPVAPPSDTGLSNNNYYTNTAGNEVHSPAYSNSAPSGATAQCRDGSYSFSQSRRGTCSHHGGVARWL